MSRCFPYPPPDYRREEKSLTESIKIMIGRSRVLEKLSDIILTDKYLDKLVKSKVHWLNDDPPTFIYKTKIKMAVLLNKKHCPNTNLSSNENGCLQFLWPHCKFVCWMFFICFPIIYIALGLTNSGARRQLQKERETTKESRKEKRKEKKEKKEKRDKSKDKHEHSKHREHGHKKRKYDESTELQTKDGYQKAATKDAVEQLEKSGLTEEHGLPFPMQEPCESSESTQNSSKSRKLEGPNISGGSHGSTILRLKLPLKKHKDLKPTPVTDEPCFSGRAISKDLEATPTNEEPCFSGQVTSKDLKVTPASKGLKSAQVIRATSRDLKATAIQATPGDLKATPAIPATSKDLKATPAVRAASEDLKATPAIRATAKDLKAARANEKPCFSGRNTSKCLEAIPADGRPSCFPGRATDAPMELELGDNAHSQTINCSKRPEAPMEQDLGDLGHSLSSSRSKKKGGSKRSRELERQFSDLIVHWKPALLLDAEAGTEDMGWLLESSRQRRVSSDTQSCSDSSIGEDLSALGSFQPRACYLPELEMYQLPYAVPF